MKIVEKIYSILSGMTADQYSKLESFQYNDLATSNVTLDRGKPSPTAVFYNITDFVFGLESGIKRERANCLVAFLDKEKKLDDDSLSQDTIITNMAELGTDFVKRIIDDGTLNIKNDEIKMKSVFLRSDSNRSGVVVELELEEKSGTCW